MGKSYKEPYIDLSAIGKTPENGIIKQGLDFWFMNKHNIKLFRFGLILVYIGVWCFIPFLIGKFFYLAYIQKDILWVLLGLFVLVGFIATIRGLHGVFKILNVIFEK